MYQTIEAGGMKGMVGNTLRTYVCTHKHTHTHTCTHTHTRARARERKHAHTLSVDNLEEATVQR